MDLFAQIRTSASVEKISNFFYPTEPETGLTFIGFICPYRTKKFTYLKNKAGEVVDLKTTYYPGISSGGRERIARIVAFRNEMKGLVRSKYVLVWADSDGYVCFLSPNFEIPGPEAVDGFVVIRNREVWEKGTRLKAFWTFCRSQFSILDNIPGKFLKEAKAELTGLFDERISGEIQSFLVNRILLSYVYDGLLMKKGVYGENPVILGVESEAVSFLQNAFFKKDERIPIVQLK